LRPTKSDIRSKCTHFQYVSKFQGNRPTQLGDIGLSPQCQKQKKTSAVKHKTAGNHRSGWPKNDSTKFDFWLEAPIMRRRTAATFCRPPPTVEHICGRNRVLGRNRRIGFNYLDQPWASIPEMNQQSIDPLSSTLHGRRHRKIKCHYSIMSYSTFSLRAMETNSFGHSSLCTLHYANSSKTMFYVGIRDNFQLICPGYRPL